MILSSNKIIDWQQDDATFLDEHDNDDDKLLIDNSDQPNSLPSSPPDGNRTSNSPTRDDRSSSLSPVPDTDTSTLPQHMNPHMALAEEKEAPLEIPQREEEEEEESATSPSATHQPPPSTTTDKADATASRQSTPLSDLSPPPDDDPQPPSSANINGNGAHHEDRDADMPADTQSKSTDDERSTVGTGNGGVDALGGIPRELDQPQSSSSSSMMMMATNGKPSSHSHTPHDSFSLTAPSTSPTQNHFSTTSPSATLANSTSSSLDGITPGTPSTTAMNLKTPPAATSTTQDPRVVSILELNVELFKYVDFLLSLSFWCSGRSHRPISFLYQNPILTIIS